MAPSLVVRPRTVEEVGRTLGEAREGIGVIPWGGGTRMALGRVPRAYHWALDLGGLEPVLDHSPGDLTVRVSAGTTLEALQLALLPAGQFLPLDPPLPHRATIGGILASASYGPLAAGYGLPRDMVIGTTVVHADGTRSRSGGRVVKNVTGYELHRLYTGSFGTLAVIVEAAFKVAPLPREERTVVADFPSPEGAVGAGLAIVRAGLAPMAVEVLGGQAWSLMSSLTPPIPVRERGYWLLTRFGGPPPAVARQEREALALCRQHGATPQGMAVLTREEGHALWRGVADLGWGEPVPPLAVRLSLLPQQGVQGIGLLEEVGPSLSPTMAIALHTPLGVLRAFWSPPLADTPALIPALQALRRRAHALGGRMLLERVPLPVKEALDPWDVPEDLLPLHRALKAQFDPLGVLNPGRFVGGI